MSDSKPHSTFANPEDQARHEQNLEWLRLMKEDPGWALSRLHVLADLEEQYQAAQDAIAEARDALWWIIDRRTADARSAAEMIHHAYGILNERIASSPASEPEAS